MDLKPLRTDEDSRIETAAITSHEKMWNIGGICSITGRSEVADVATPTDKVVTSRFRFSEGSDLMNGQPLKSGPLLHWL